MCLSPQLNVLTWEWTDTSLDLPGAVVSDDLVCDPVEDVEDEESQRERRSGYGVDSFGSVDKLSSVWLRVLEDRRCLDAVCRGTFERIAIFNTRCHVIGHKVQTAVL